MPLQLMQFRPGVSRESTTYANEGAWYACDKIRFRSGCPEKLGGWITQGTSIEGVCRNISEWVTNSGIDLLGLGTNKKFYINSGNVNFDVTPVRLQQSLAANPIYPIYSTLSSGISATDAIIPVTSGTSFTRVYPYVVKIDNELIYIGSASGSFLANCIRGYAGTTPASHGSGAIVSSSWVAIASVANGASVGDYVTISGATAFSPYLVTLLNAEFEIGSVATDYIGVDLGEFSTSATNGGGASVVATYQISPGAAYTVSGSGWGAGPWVSLVPTSSVSTLSSAINATVTTITVASTATFGAPAATGYLQIESEIMSYTVASATDLTVVRSTYNNTNHAAGTSVIGVVYVVGSHAWNTAYSAAFASDLIRLWSSDNYGQDFVYCPRNGAIYYWSGATDITTAGVVTAPGVDILDLSGADGYAPTAAIGVLTTEERHIVAMGSTDTAISGSTDQDPLMISWCSQEEPTIWDPSDITNTAGNYRLGVGSKIVAWQKTRQEILVWTDNALYSMRYLGPPYVYGFNPISVGDVSIASQNASVTAGGVTYWMGLDKFYAYSGRVDTMPCSLRQYVFDGINNAQLDQVYAGANEKYNEVWWWYCSTDSTFPDRYVIYNYLEKLWYYGTLNRTAWYDSHIRTYPIAYSYDPVTEMAQMFYQEYGHDDGSTDPALPITAYITSADFDIGDGGNQFSFVKRIIPDIDFIGSTTNTPSLTTTLQARNYPGKGVITSPMQNLTSPTYGTKVSTQIYNYTEQAWVRLRGRQLIFHVESSDLGVQWQLGVFRLDIQPDGKR